MIQNGKSEPASRILLVDDDPIDLQLLKSVLKREGYAVELASGGELALKIAQSTLPDLIVLDVMMPGMDGYQVCERLKASERTRDIPVIFVTGRSGMRDKVMGFKSGAVDYITKPYQMEAVLAQVGSHLAVQAMQKQLAEQNRQLHREIVERQQAEEMLKLSEEKYRALVENINDVVFCLDTESRFTYVNPVIERLTQYRVDEIMRLPIDRFVHPDDLSGLQAELQQILAGAVGLYEFRLFAKNGAVLHVHTSSRALWEGDQLMGVTGIMTDITERKRAEKELGETAHFLQHLIDTIPNPIFYKDTQGIYRGCNAAFEAYLGSPREKIIGTSVYNMAPKDLADKYHEMDMALFRQWGVQLYESQVRYADGTRHDVIFNKATFTNVDGSLGGLVGVILDITERKRAEEALRESEELYRLILTSISDAVFITDDTGLFKFICPSVDVIFGYSFQEVQAMGNIARLLGEALFAPAELEPSGEIQNIERDIIDKTGTTHTLLVTVKRVSIRGGTRLYACRDITAHKRAEETLREKEKQMLP